MATRWPVLDRHLTRILEGFASSVVQIGGVTGAGQFSEDQNPDVDDAGNPVIRTERVLLLQVTTWPDLRPQQTATIDDVDYRITGVELRHGGRVWHATVRRAA